MKIIKITCGVDICKYLFIGACRPLSIRSILNLHSEADKPDYALIFAES